LQLATPFLSWLSPGLIEVSASLRPLTSQDLAALPPGQRIATELCLALPTLVLAYGLWHLHLMFRAFAAGRVFHRRPIGHLRTFSIVLLAQGILKPSAGALASVVATFTRPAGERMVSIGLSDAEATLLFSGALLLVIAWILGEAARLHDENQGFV
jgi:hypothetical protein